MGRIVHFELTADDVSRAVAFYANAFGWTADESPFAPGYHVANTGAGAGINGAIMPRAYQSQPAILWIEVDDIDAARATAAAAGGAPVGEVNEIPGRGRVGYARDTEGNLIGLIEPAGDSR